MERVVVNYARQEMNRGEIIGIYFNEANSECVRSEVPGGRDRYSDQARDDRGVLHNHQPNHLHQHTATLLTSSSRLQPGWTPKNSTFTYLELTKQVMAKSEARWAANIIFPPYEFWQTFLISQHVEVSLQLEALERAISVAAASLSLFY